MGKIIKDSTGKVLTTANGGAIEITSSIDSNIQAGNIKKDVTILGITGTYEGSGGGSEPSIVTIELDYYDFDDNVLYDGGNTFNAISEAVSDGKVCRVHLNNWIYGNIYLYSSIISGPENLETMMYEASVFNFLDYTNGVHVQVDASTGQDVMVYSTNL